MQASFIRLAALGLAAWVLAAVTAPAQAGGHVHWSVGIHAAPGVTFHAGSVRPLYAPPVYLQPPIVYAPPPVVYAPPPVVYTPAPVLYSRPLYVRPAPVYHHGGRDWRDRGHGRWHRHGHR